MQFVGICRVDDSVGDGNGYGHGWQADAYVTVNGGTLTVTNYLLTADRADSRSWTVLNGGTLKFADAGSLAITGSLNVGGSSVLDLSRITVSGPSNITLASTTAGVTGNLGDITLQGFSPLAGYDAALQTIDNNLVLTVNDWFTAVEGEEEAPVEASEAPAENE